MTITTSLPEVHGAIAPDGSLTVSVAGEQPVTISGPAGPVDLADARSRLVAAVADTAQRHGHGRVVAHLTDPETGTMMVAVTASGVVEEVTSTPRPEAPIQPPAQPVQAQPMMPVMPPTAGTAPGPVAPDYRPSQPTPEAYRPGAPEPAAATTAPAVQSSRPSPASVDTLAAGAPAPVAQPPVSTFLVTEPPAEPARAGWRGAVNRLGLSLAAPDSEVYLRRCVRLISQHWPGLRTVAVANTKGSAAKTPTTIALAAAFARHGGGGVAAVDNNPTRGTLPWRTEKGPHDATVTDLLPHINRLLEARASSASQMAAFLHHQTEDRYEVLRSKPEKIGAPFTADEFDSVVEVLSKYYRLLVFDSGNDETAATWQHMIDTATQLVVPTLARREWAETGRLLLTELSRRSEHGYNLARNAVVIVSQADHDRGLGPAQEIADGFKGLVRATAVIPYDPHMVEGHLRWDGMARPTREAWIRAAALVAAGF